MVTRISERRLVILFVEGLFEPIKGWIKAFDPPNLQEAMRKARSMELTTSRSKSNSEPSSSQTGSKSEDVDTKKNRQC